MQVEGGEKTGRGVRKSKVASVAKTGPRVESVSRTEWELIAPVTRANSILTDAQVDTGSKLHNWCRVRGAMG